MWTQSERPGDELLVAAGVSSKRLRIDDTTDDIQRDRDVYVLVGVHADDHSTTTRIRGHACHCYLQLDLMGGDAGRAGGRDCDGTVAIRLL